MQGEKVSPQVKCLSEAIILWRQSTRRFNAGTARLKSAVGFIRQHACEGIGAREVVQYLGYTRRKAERDFRAFTGHSIMAEILDVRYARACELLKERAARSRASTRTAAIATTRPSAASSLRARGFPRANGASAIRERRAPRRDVEFLSTD